MAKKHLVIVESPAKAKTIGKYLGKDYEVKAAWAICATCRKASWALISSTTSSLSISHPRKRGAHQRAQKGCQEQRHRVSCNGPGPRGRSISWHLKALLNLDDEKAKRVTFNEITKKVVSESIKEPRAIDQDLVDAQQARRVLDRIVGYQLSPLLWKKVRRGLSAGRVQSVAVRMVDDREKEIQPSRRRNTGHLTRPHRRGDAQDL